MQNPKDEYSTYDSCLADGHIREVREINTDRISSLMENAQISIDSAKIVMKAIKQDAREWLSVYVSHYEALRIYAEAFLSFDKVDISNHKCLFAYLCAKHPELEFDWSFFEKIRTKRNGVNYYGDKASYEDWKSAELQFNIYSSTIKKEIEKKLKELEK